MIEVLVASTILLVIVMMLAMLFQQTSMAWRTGLRRADASMQIRSLIGSIQRDAAKAVAENSIPKELRDLLGGSQSFGSGALAFYTLSADGFQRDDFSDFARRSLSFVEYTSKGTRRETILLANGNKEVKDSNVGNLFLDSTGKPEPHVVFEIIKAAGAPAGSLPLSILFRADITPQGFNLEIGAASDGPDGAWGTKDDICTWSKKKK